jgi:2-phosphoglycerate kinase
MVDDTELGLGERDGALPYSKGLMAQSLMAAGLPPERAYGVAAAVERWLQQTGGQSITFEELRPLAEQTLGAEAGEALMARLAQWRRLRLLQRPIIILIGGTTGVGKSTLASQLAHRLGIVRVVSTDTVRQVMRAFFAPELMPAIHFSSFDCAGAVRFPVPEETDLSRAGFIEQAKAVAVGVEAVVARAVEEKQNMILEGVHLVPTLLDRRRWGDALVIELVMAVPDVRRHRTHFTVRDWESGGVRPLRKYVKHFHEIRRIQDYILAKAHEQGVLVIANDSIDEAVNEAMTEVLRAVSEQDDEPSADAMLRNRDDVPTG